MTTTTEMPVLLVVDDHPIVLEGLESVLTKAGYKVLSATSATKAMNLACHYSDIEVFIIDMSLMSATDGLDFVNALREAGLMQPVIIYTMHEELWHISMLLDSKVQGVVLKGDDLCELQTAIRRVRSGGSYFSTLFAGLCQDIKQTKGLMSRKDLEVLRRLSDGETSQQIACALGLGSKAIEYHRSNIIKKLGAKNMTEAISRAFQLGMIPCLAAFTLICAQAAENEPQSVDLGLSVRWADRNLNAPAPLEAGDFYAFGETSSKDYYDWSTYEHCINGSWYQHTYIGEESIAGTEFDAAYVTLGEGWRMPVAEEVEELIETCTYECFEAEPYGYIRFTAPNNAYIDIPFVGYMSLGRVVYENIQGSVWSGSFIVDEGEFEDMAYYMNAPLFFGLATYYDPFIEESSVQLGFQIRPVYTGAVGVEGISATAAATVSPEVYTLEGIKVGTSTDGLPTGIYIVRQGSEVRKIAVR